MEFKVEAQFVEEFREKGFTVIPGFLTPKEVLQLKESTKQLVQKYCENNNRTTFSTKPETMQGFGTFFAESGDNIRQFYEDAALDKDGRILTSDTLGALHRIGHAVHKFEPVFQAIALGPKVKAVVKSLTEMKEPTVIQSMIIFKNPKVGGPVLPHQDASFLYCEPMHGTLLGFWIALDDAGLENGCLKFIPSSHKGKLHQRFIRNPDKTSENLFVYTGENIPEIPAEKFVSAACKSGDLVLIDGLVIHQSESNTSDHPRTAFTFHVLDGTADYSEENWLQPTAANTFMRIP